MPVRPSYLIAAVVLVAAGSSQARGPSDSPPALQKVFDCRAITDNTARLACYDANVGQLSEARTRGDIAMVDREQVKDAKRKLFGFSLSSISLFNHDKDDKGDKDIRKAARADEVEEITAKIRTVGHNAEGALVITLEDGARWEQTDAMIFGRAPKPGSTATIKRGAFGSFKVSIDGSPSAKVRRIG